MHRLILGTAGHIDHGKTALVRALTGVDTDRLEEEKRRGITIDLGFARLAEDDDVEFGIVDVPGHEAFVRNMLAGATGIDLVLLVVAADEGVMPQTREHLAIVELLGVRGGVVAVTKSDLVEPDWLELVVEDVRDGLRATPFADASIVPVSAVTGAGLDALRRALRDTSHRIGDRRVEDLARLPVDRVFTVKGTGTVVTGTLWSGRLRRDTAVHIQPGGGAARVRGIQVHGADVDEAVAGQRVAVALGGVDRAGIQRGAVLVADPAWRPSRMPTVRLRLVRDTDWEVKPRQRVRFHLGTAEVMGRVALLGADRLGPGDASWAQLRLEAPVVARAGDRFVIRSYSPVTTIGGGIVVEPAPQKRKRLVPADVARFEAILAGDPDAILSTRLDAAGWRGVPLDALPVDTPFAPGAVAAAVERRIEADAAVRVGSRIYASAIAAESRARLLDAVDSHHRAHPLEVGIEREELRRMLPAEASTSLVEWALDGLLSDGVLRAAAGRVARQGYRPELSAEQARIRDRILTTLAAGGLTPPLLAELPDELVDRPDLSAIVRLLEEDGAVVALTPELLIERRAVDEAANLVRDRFGGRDGLGPADFKAVLPVTRKYLIPLLEHFDRIGVTVRRGDSRQVPAG